MCSPQAAQITAQIATFVIEDEASKDQVKFSEERSQELADATVDDAISKFGQLNRRGVQESEAASRQIQAISRQARLAGGAVRADAGASGVEGNSIDALARDFEAQELSRIEIARENLDNTRGNLEDQAQGVSAEAQARLFNNAPDPVARPSLFNALFSVGTSLASSFATNTEVDPETGETV